MNSVVHKTKTEIWSRDQGFNKEQSLKIAYFCNHIDKKILSKPIAHFAIFGAHIYAFILLYMAIIFNSVKFLGYAIHAKQDAISHGLIMPWNHNKNKDIDKWESLPAARQKLLELQTRKYLNRFIKYRKII